MFEIAAAVVMVVLFYKTAKERNRNPWIWGLVGLVSFFGTIFIVNLILRMVFGNLMEKDSLRIIYIIINIVVGILGATVVKKAILEQR